MGLSLVLAAAGLLVAAQPDADQRVVRRSVVDGWTVTDIAESDGGRIVELGRDGRTFSIRHHAIFWRGNGGERRGTLFSYSDCSSGGDETPVDARRRPDSADFRRQFQDYFAECGVGRSEQARLLRGLDRAYCLFDRWTAEAAAATANENARIAAYGSGRRPMLVRPARPTAPCRTQLPDN
ncbi:MAG TPA: hypothetical protein VGC46_11145 [Allosphingosinicella sp.]